MTRRDDDPRTARQVSRSLRRRAGDRSAELARTLMKLPDSAIKRLAIEDELREAIDRARVVTAHIARRRAERTLAGDLRQFDVSELEQQLERLEQSRGPDVQHFHLAERWRARLIEQGAAAAAEFPGGATDELLRLIAAAQRERDVGKPPGAARALFRHVAEALKPRPAGGDSDGDGDGDGDNAD
ncbi:MAG: ribosome biogenesis factor YjgA [Kofleriaceae bacterium]